MEIDKLNQEIHKLERAHFEMSLLNKTTSLQFSGEFAEVKEFKEQMHDI
jgi:hypothetical protein